MFDLHKRGLTRVEVAERPSEDVNEAIEQLLDGTAPAARLVFRPDLQKSAVRPEASVAHA